MNNHSAKPDNMPWLIPYLVVKDGQQSLDFYQKAFGFSELDIVRSETGMIQHGELKYKDQVIMFSQEGAFDNTYKTPVSGHFEPPISLYVYCDDVDDFFKNATAHGATMLQEPEDAFWGDRMCKLSDPNGYIWCFATKIGM